METSKLLLIEDDPMIQTLLVEVFGDAGYRVSTAMADDSLPQALQVSPDIAVIGCDGRGTFAEGWNVAQLLRNEFPSIALIMLSTNLSAIHEVGQTERGRLFDGAIRKPFTIMDLLQTIDRCHYARQTGTVVYAYAPF